MNDTLSRPAQHPHWWMQPPSAAHRKPVKDIGCQISVRNSLPASVFARTGGIHSLGWNGNCDCIKSGELTLTALDDSLKHQSTHGVESWAQAAWDLRRVRAVRGSTSVAAPPITMRDGRNDSDGRVAGFQRGRRATKSHRPVAGIIVRTTFAAAAE